MGINKELLKGKDRHFIAYRIEQAGNVRVRADQGDRAKFGRGVPDEGRHVISDSAHAGGGRLAGFLLEPA